MSKGRQGGTVLTAAIDRARCQGHAQCLIAAPEVFGLDDEGIAVAAARGVLETEVEAIRKAARFCPVGAIQLVETVS